MRNLRSVLAATLLLACAPATVLGQPCDTAVEETFTVQLPLLGLPPDDEGQGWVRPPVWEHHPDAYADSITVPNGRPIYALIVSGYESNKYLDELMVYNFARHLMERGAYVHYAWWNNLLAPYMERPLHHSQSDPGAVTFGHLLETFSTPEGASEKAAPGEDYQFVADAKLFLSAIRQHNPNAIIIVVGHSMGGGAVVHLASQTNVVIDILAPLDPTGNRNYPWTWGPIEGTVGCGVFGNGVCFHPEYNWTRWRANHTNFLGYRSAEWNFNDGCHAVGPWLKDTFEASSELFCGFGIFVHDAPRLTLGANVVNLHHRYQQEAKFPYDWGTTGHFLHNRPPDGTTSNQVVGTDESGSDPNGWPDLFHGGGINENNHCCYTLGNGIAWPADGHGEIIGYRGPVLKIPVVVPVPIGVRVRTSPQCGANCPTLVWPSRALSGQVWSNGNGASRRQLLQNLETLPAGAAWPHRPKNPDLCLVSQGLISRFDSMNQPPIADAGADQVIECPEATLDGSGSSDPDNELTYAWSWPAGGAFGPVVTIPLPLGTHCITLLVADRNGHIDRDMVTVTVYEDVTPPSIECPAPVSVDCTEIGGSPPGVGTPATHPVIAAFLSDAAASDECGGIAALAHDAPDFFAVGETVITFTATDANGNVAECASSVYVTNGCATSVGACCLPSGSCWNTVVLSCNATAGAWQGGGTSCTTIDCREPSGACCLGSTGCSVVTLTACLITGGAYQGHGAGCGQCVPAVGACCLADGSCAQETQSDCTALVGGYQGDETTCATTPCPKPGLTGACCFQDASCAETTGTVCIGTGGTYQGDGMACAAIACPAWPPVGACCYAGGTCGFSNQGPCISVGGSWMGPGSSCQECLPLGGDVGARSPAVAGVELAGTSAAGSDPALANMDTAPARPCSGDIDGSGSVDSQDLAAVIMAIGTCRQALVPCAEDLDGNRAVDSADVLALIAKWGACP